LDYGYYDEILAAWQTASFRVFLAQPFLLLDEQQAGNDVRTVVKLVAAQQHWQQRLSIALCVCVSVRVFISHSNGQQPSLSSSRTGRLVSKLRCAQRVMFNVAYQIDSVTIVANFHLASNWENV